MDVSSNAYVSEDIALLRWRIQLAEYDYKISYRRGSQNTNADALSRIGSVSKEDGW